MEMKAAKFVLQKILLIKLPSFFNEYVTRKNMVK